MFLACWADYYINNDKNTSITHAGTHGVCFFVRISVRLWPFLTMFLYRYMQVMGLPGLLRGPCGPVWACKMHIESAADSLLVGFMSGYDVLHYTL